MSETKETKQEAERQLTDELAKRPKDDGPGTKESDDRRADAEKAHREAE
jgi:hypothetical protein